MHPSITNFPLLAVVLAFLAAIPAPAQTDNDQPMPEASSPAAPRYGKPDTIRFRVGAEITASNGACRNILAAVTVPLDCPEQQVKILDEELSSEVAEISYRDLPGGEVRQMVISVPVLPEGATARAVVTAEVTTRPILPPESTDGLTIPKRIPPKLRIYTSGSPYIEVQHQRIRSVNKEIRQQLADTASDWEKIEAIYDYVLQHVEYVEGPDKGALQSLRDGHADCQGRSMVFIALCRANKIPARMVWVHGHAYPEFYLEDSEGRGYWYPCESAGTRSFGEMPLARTILQKGDNFRVPERKDRLRYASDYLIGLPTPGGGKPQARFIREQLPQ